MTITASDPRGDGMLGQRIALRFPGGDSQPVQTERAEAIDTVMAMPRSLNESVGLAPQPG